MEHHDKVVVSYKWLTSVTSYVSFSIIFSSLLPHSALWVIKIHHVFARPNLDIKSTCVRLFISSKTTMKIFGSFSVIFLVIIGINIALSQEPPQPGPFMRLLRLLGTLLADNRQNAQAQPYFYYVDQFQLANFPNRRYYPSLPGQTPLDPNIFRFVPPIVNL